MSIQSIRFWQPGPTPRGAMRSHRVRWSAAHCNCPVLGHGRGCTLRWPQSWCRSRSNATGSRRLSPVGSARTRAIRRPRSSISMRGCARPWRLWASLPTAARTGLRTPNAWWARSNRRPSCRPRAFQDAGGGRRWIPRSCSSWWLACWELAADRRPSLAQPTPTCRARRCLTPTRLSKGTAS